MGIKSKNEPGLGAALFSKTQRQVLGLLFGHPERSYFLSEIVRFAGVGSGTIQRELEKLTRVGLLTVSKVGNQKHYQANHTSPIFHEIRGIVVKTFGVAGELCQALTPLAAKIQVAFVYGSIARGTDTAESDIDIMIISEGLSYPEVITVFSEAEAKLGRAVNPTLYHPDELRRKLAEDNSFIQRVTQQEKIFLIGSQDDIPKP